ncbi:hypothetical protein Y1Q_0012798 [Alligator mississippiensis]|uniref:Uncharacterized protein n=1 Tax=Alligator mississippiensis TaxID=8496 RepID=A0A151M1C0_ALLMI|nr:hypothetical protein Y1Q_0012798 [Alligator mississippiensis]
MAENQIQETEVVKLDNRKPKPLTNDASADPVVRSGSQPEANAAGIKNEGHMDANSKSAFLEEEAGENQQQSEVFIHEAHPLSEEDFTAKESSFGFLPDCETAVEAREECDSGQTRTEMMHHTDVTDHKGDEESTECSARYSENLYSSNTEWMTVEFIAPLSKKWKFKKDLFKIVVVIYEKPGLYQEFATMKTEINKDIERIIAKRKLSLSNLQQGQPFYYRYGILDTFSENRPIQLEDFPGTTSKNKKSPINRVLHIPEWAIKPSGVWTQFDDLCHLQNKKQWDIQNFSLAWSSDSQDIIGYVVKEFHQKSRKDFTDLERKIECYIHCSKALTKSDVVEKKTTEVCCKEEINIIYKFAKEILQWPRTPDCAASIVQDLLFSLYILFHYEAPMTEDLWKKLKKVFPHTSSLEDKLANLTEDRECVYIHALMNICEQKSRKSERSGWMWLIPLLYAVAYQRPTSELAQDLLHKEIKHLPFHVLTKESNQEKLLKMIETHRTFIGKCAPLAEKIIEIVTLKSLNQMLGLQIQLPFLPLLTKVQSQIFREGKTKEEASHAVLEQLARVTESWIRDKRWKKLICPSYKEWIKKIERGHVFGHYVAFLQTEEYQGTELEFSFSEHVIQNIKEIPKAKDTTLEKIIQYFSSMKDPVLEKIISPIIERMWTEELSLIKEPTCFEEETGNVLTRLLDSSLGQDIISTIQKSKDKIRINEKAEELLSKVLKLISFVGDSLFSGDIPFSVLQDILKHKQEFIAMLCVSDKLLQRPERFTPHLITDVLNVRELEYRQVETQKNQKHVFINMCTCISDDIKVGLEDMQQSIDEKQSIKNQIVIKQFSTEGEKKSKDSEPPALAKYDDMVTKVYTLQESKYFLKMWKLKAEQAKDKLPGEAIFSLDEVREHIYIPAIEDFQKTYWSLRDSFISFGNIERQFDMLMNKKELLKEFEIMESSIGEPGSEPSWVKAAMDKIDIYETLSTVVQPARMINELRRQLGLDGDFQILDDLTRYGEEYFKNKRLDYITNDVKEVKETLSNLSTNVLNFLKELLRCTEKAFVSWVKDVIKDKTELPTFVDLASISAGENDMDIDKVRFFRDAISVSGPIIFDLQSTSGFKDFHEALHPIRDAIVNDDKLPEKLRDSCDNKEWLQMVHDCHGSVERSSVSQARAINSKGIFIISAPQKLKAQDAIMTPHIDGYIHTEEMIKNGHLDHQAGTKFHLSYEMPSLDDCISLKLPEDDAKSASQQAGTGKKVYSLAQLTELQNKLMLIATKVEHGQEEVKRFLEILEKVRMVGKLYLELLDIGNILFIDWKAELKCSHEHNINIYVEFGISGVLVQSNRPFLEELSGICKAMERCLIEWKKYLEIQRNNYYHLNMFTARQLFYLCSKLATPNETEVDLQVLNLLSVFKHDITIEDIRDALNKALNTPSESINVVGEDDKSMTWFNYTVKFPQLIQGLVECGYDESVIKAGLQSYSPNAAITEQMLMDYAFDHGDNEEEIEEFSKLYDEQREDFLQESRKFKNRSTETEHCAFSSLTKDELAVSFEGLLSIEDKVNLLWDAYCSRLTGLVSDRYISLDLFGEMLKHLATVETSRIERNLPAGVEAGRPCLVMCKEEEMLRYMLSVYQCTENAPLPTYEEVLVCTSETEEEDIELIVRRALSLGSKHKKIYCLLGADKLVYKVSKQLEFQFFHLAQSSCVPDYRFLIFCDAKAHSSYIVTAFDNYKVPLSCNSEAEIQQYLRTHLTVSSAPAIRAFEKPYQQNVKFVFSEEAGMGKSLFAANTIRKAKDLLENAGLAHKTIRMTESKIDFGFLVKELCSLEEKPTEAVPRIFHIDISPVVSKGLYRLLIELCILRHTQSPDGLVWKCKASHLYLIEYLVRGKGISSTRKQEMTNKMEKEFLALLPTVKCVSPVEVLEILEKSSSGTCPEMEQQLLDKDTFKGKAFQRSYQYLCRYQNNKNLDSFRYSPESVEGTEETCLRLLLQFCGQKNPSWTELSNFTQLLSLQLMKCETSVFCSKAAGREFWGFKSFVIKFMITMSKDFAMPSLVMSDESSPRGEDKKEEDSMLRGYQLRRKWEQESHPYIVFHADNHSMEFLGFHINENYDAVDAYSGTILQNNVISPELYLILHAQSVPFNKKFEDLPRKEQLETLCSVFGVTGNQDPDESYKLTLDNTMKMLAIHLRFQCGIPVIIMGETGCGKTKLVEFMCSLQRAGRDIQNMMLVRVHGGTSSHIIHQKVREAIELARRNEEEYDVDTVLFFDEANTTEAVFAIKEVLCDHSINGEQIPTTRLRVVAACNPYKRHTKETIEKLEKAGLGYRVRSEDTLEKLGYVPLRQLVYRVQPLPPSMLPLVWDFGELNEQTQRLYIQEIVRSIVKDKLPEEEKKHIFTSVILASQNFLRTNKHECRITSLRDVERCMKVLLWFYNLKDLLFPLIDQKKSEAQRSELCNSVTDLDEHKEGQMLPLNAAQRSLVLSMGVCYYMSLERCRQDYLEVIAECFSVPAHVLHQEIVLCQEVFLDNLSIPKLEKHCLEMNTILNSREVEVKTKLQQWAKSFATVKNADCYSASWAASDPKEQDVFIGFNEDVSATVILQCSQSSLQGNFVFNEEQVLGACKSKLIECATPDSILRLKYSSLEDAKQIQDLYFGQQKHSGLIDILRKSMKDQSNVDETKGLCLQVSTHARLLNQRELDMVTKKLNLQNRICCVFLSQFETEHAFRQEISKFFRRSPEEKLLLVQFSFDEPQSSKRLLACAKYCTVDERRKSQSPGSSHVVIISKVPRIQGGSGYLAFSGDKWTSLHLDELLPPEHFSASLGQLSKITVAEVFTKSTRQGLHTDGSTKPGCTESVSHSLEESVQLLDVEFLIKQCVQKAVIQLEDKRDNQKRATIRIQLLYDALFPAQKKTAFANDFMGVLKKRICHLLQEREERSLKPKEWTFHQAMSGKFILEGTSFRHTLWIYVEDIMVNVFAQILAVIDANNNLNCISQETPRSSLWLQMFQDESFLKIKYTSKEPDAKIAVLSMTEDPNTSVACQFPFSWVLKAALDEIWETVHQAKGFPRDPTPDSIEMFQSSTQNVPMPDGDDMDMIQFYASDFVRMALPGQDVEVYKVLSSVLITGAKKLHSSVARNDLQFSLLWLHVEYFYLRDTYQLFIDLVKNEESVTGELQKMYSEDSTKMFLSLDALNTILRQLQPTEETFGSFDSCLAWLKRIKSIKHALNRITSDDYQIRLDRKKGELLSSILHRWDCTNITYLLIDHLLHDETKMDEKLLKTIVKQSVFLWKNLYKTEDLKPEKIFEVVTKVLKICSSNAVNVYFVKGVDKCRSCQKEITDPAELPCEHIFCTQCILSWTDKQCRICKKNIPEDYTPTASQVTREAVENCNKFRRKCNSFFLECVSSYCFGGRNPPPAKVIEQLIKFVACKPSNSEHTESRCVYKPTSDLSPFEECMDPSPTVKSSLLKMLLQCRFDDVKTHLQEYISLMEGVITSNQSIRDDFYFMVVCCFEDFMYSSFQEDASQEAEQCITSADLTTPSCTEATEVDTLQLIARLRLAISHVATVLGTELLNAAVPTTEVNHEVTEKQRALVNSMKILVENAQTPWPQIFLMRALLNIHGLKIMKKVLEKEQWILPRGCETSKCMDVRSNEVLMISALDRAKHHLNNAKSEAAKHLTSVMKQMESILEAPLLSEDPTERLEKIMNAIRSHGNSTYLEVVFHTAVILSLSQRPITQVFRSICFEPSTVKDTYLPTMPDDHYSDTKNWKMDEISKIWSCKCGQIWCIDRCGLPMEKKTCSCGHPVGGLNHKAVEGFAEVNRSKDIIERGYILGSPGSRSREGERDLPPASVCLARVLLHSSMLLGTFTECQSVLNLMKEKPQVAEEFFQEHLEKDITFLAESLGRNIDDATIIVHLFLRYLLDSTEDEEITVKSMHEKEDRKKWESCFKTLTHSIFQGLKDKLASAKQEIAEEAHSSSILKIAEGQTLPFSDLSSTGLINKSCIWQFEQKMTVQHLTHLIQQENGTNQFPVLLEILSKHQNIQYIQHLPDVLSLQHTLIHFYQNCNHEEEQFSVREFLEKPHISGDQRLSFEGAVRIIQKVWSNIKLNPESKGMHIPEQLQNKEIGTDTAILDLLPHNPSISFIVTKFLIELQNSLIDTAAQIMKEKQRSISAEEVRASSVIAVTPGDVVTMALSNFQYVLEENGIKTTHFNFQTLQRQAINRFISGKPIIKVQTAPSMPPRNLKTLKSTKAKVKQQLQQEQLSVSQMKSIMETARSVSDISRALSTLKVAAEFLAVTGGDPKRSLTDYVRNELRMAADAKHFKDLPVVPQTQLKHILSLWQVLSVRRSVLLVQMNQNPFFLVDKRYQEELEVTEREDLKKALSTINIDFFITDLHEMIVVTLADYKPEWEIVEIFRTYLEEEEKEDMYIENLIGSLSPHLQMKKVISVWKTAVQTSKLYSSSYKQE